MNVLLAEANVSYDLLKDLDESNASFDRTDVALVIGANDVVNPASRTDPAGPIAGMPILDVDKTAMVVVKRRSSPGFAGIPKPLFVDSKTIMLFGALFGTVSSRPCVPRCPSALKGKASRCSEGISKGCMSRPVRRR
jgi:NAD(P) transhydrogenase subunit beta